MTRATNRTTTDSVMTTWDANHLKGRELASTLTDEKRVALGLWNGGRINIDVQRRNPGGSLGNITGGKKGQSSARPNKEDEEKSRTHPLCWTSAFPFA